MPVEMPETVPRYGENPQRRYPPCETCVSKVNLGGIDHPADYVMEEPGAEPHFQCHDCACTALFYAGRHELLADLEAGRGTVMFLRRDPKSPSYRGGLF